MDHIPSTAAISAATQKAQPVDSAALTVAKELGPQLAAGLDPRSIYTLSPEASDAVLALAQTRAQAIQTAEFGARNGRGPQAADAVIAISVAVTPIVSVEPTKSVGAANRNWNEDVRLEPLPSRRVGADLTVQYGNPRVMAAWSAAFPDIAGRKFRGLQVSDTHVKLALAEAAKEAGFTGRQTDIYLICNGERFKTFSEDHPNTKINWINVDDADLMIIWPKDLDSE